MARVDLSTLSEMTLTGDEDCGVALHCKADECYRGGQPLAYYEGISPAYRGEDVAQVDSIAGLVLAAVTHRTWVHRDVPAAV